MRKLVIRRALGALAFVAVVGTVAASVRADMRQETTTTTTYRGTVTDLEPSTIVIKTEKQEPARYTINEKTTFLDSSGNVVTREQIRNVPVTVYAVKEGDRQVVTKVITTTPRVERKTTTEEIETHD